MGISLTEQESLELAQATTSARQVRQWRRYLAIQLLAMHQTPKPLADMLGCSLASVYNRATAWQEGRQGALQEAVHAGRSWMLDQAALRL